mgnify:CR=1 FL=1
MTKSENDPETGSLLQPKYDSNGLITAVVTDDSTGELLMLAHMNAEALQLTQDSGVAHFFSRSRQSLWIKAAPAGPACHTGRTSCFYRKIVDGKLEPVG